MLSFRVPDDDAVAATRWAERLGVDRSTVLRDALRLHLVRLEGENELAAWVALPPTADESALSEIASWGPTEDWSDWDDAAR